MIGIRSGRGLRNDKNNVKLSIEKENKNHDLVCEI